MKTMIISFMKAIHTDYFRNYEFLIYVGRQMKNSMPRPKKKRKKESCKSLMLL